MEYRALGRSGLRISEISLGTWLTVGKTVDARSATALIQAALDSGINTFDTADGYGGGEAERLLGRCLAEVPRREYVVATKCFFPRSQAVTDRGLSRKHIVESVDQSLRNLRMDHIDVMQCHRYDDETPLDETVDALTDLVRQGKILYWGVSRWSPSQIREAASLAERRYARAPISQQLPYNLFNRRAEADFGSYRDMGVGVLGYSPLAQGILTGKYTGATPPPDSRAADPQTRSGMWDFTAERIGVAARLSGIAKEAGHTPVELALGWCLRRPEVASVVVGAKTPQQLQASTRASGVRLTSDVLALLETLCPVPDAEVASP
jgi:aryl-alcohol dehydrogenase-like predicted oxidoreductase